MLLSAGICVFAFHLFVTLYGAARGARSHSAAILRRDFSPAVLSDSRIAISGALCSNAAANASISSSTIVPIFLVIGDRLKPAKAMIQSIYNKLDSPFEVVVIDLGSKYAPIQTFIESLPSVYNNITIIRNGANVASTVREYLESRRDIKFFVISDADLSLRGCKADVLLFMAAVLKACPSVAQIGTSLRVDNIPEFYPMRERTYQWEKGFRSFDNHIAAEWDYLGQGDVAFVELFKAPVEGTFSMHRRGDEYWLNNTHSIRVGPPYMAEHLPWYSNKFPNYAIDQAPGNVTYASYKEFCPGGNKDSFIQNITLAITNGMQEWVCKRRSEQLVLQGIIHILRTSATSDCIMFDIGSNSGFFGLVGIAYGCDAVFFDVQKACTDLVSGALQVNMFQNKSKINLMAISDELGHLSVSTTQVCSGEGFTMKSQSSMTINNAVKVDTLVNHVALHSKVLIVKIDTEGNEFKVLRGALPLFKRHQILNAFVEVTPCCNFWGRIGVNRTQVADLFFSISSLGYGMWVLGESSKHAKSFNKKPFLLTKPLEIQKYVRHGDFMQQDMWLFLLGGADTENFQF